MCFAAMPNEWNETKWKECTRTKRYVETLKKFLTKIFVYPIFSLIFSFFISITTTKMNSIIQKNLSNRIFPWCGKEWWLGHFYGVIDSISLLEEDEKHGWKWWISMVFCVLELLVAFDASAFTLIYIEFSFSNMHSSSREWFLFYSGKSLLFYLLWANAS